MDQKILKADRTRQRRVAGMFGAGVALGAVSIQSILPYATEVIKKWPPQQAVWAMGALLIVGFLSVVPVGVYIFRVGRRVLVAGQYPVPGMTVLVDTRVIEGNPALVYGRIFKLFGTLIALAGIAGASYVLSFVVRLFYL